MPVPNKTPIRLKLVSTNNLGKAVNFWEFHQAVQQPLTYLSPRPHPPAAPDLLYIVPFSSVVQEAGQFGYVRNYPAFNSLAWLKRVECIISLPANVPLDPGQLVGTAALGSAHVLIKSPFV